MARSMWSGAVELVAGLSVPVKLSTAVTDSGPVLHQVRKSDGSRIRYQRFAQADGAEVPYADIEKGYELPDGRTVVLSDDDFRQAYGEKSRLAKIVQFTDRNYVPRTAAAASYYVEPDKGGEKAYALLAETMLRTGMVAIVSIALRQREAIAMLYTRGDGYLILERLNWAADVKEPDFAAPRPDLTAAEIDLAENLVTQMTSGFNWAAFEDKSEENLRRVIDAKTATGQAVGSAAAPAGPPADMTELLAAAVAAEKAKRAPVSATRQKTAAPRKPRTPRAKAAA